MRRTMRWTEAPHGAITNGNHIGGARSTPTFYDALTHVASLLFCLRLRFYRLLELRSSNALDGR